MTTFYPNTPLQCSVAERDFLYFVFTTELVHRKNPFVQPAFDLLKIPRSIRISYHHFKKIHDTHHVPYQILKEHFVRTVAAFLVETSRFYVTFHERTPLESYGRNRDEWMNLLLCHDLKKRLLPEVEFNQFYHATISPFFEQLVLESSLNVQLFFETVRNLTVDDSTRDRIFTDVMREITLNCDESFQELRERIVRILRNAFVTEAEIERCNREIFETYIDRSDISLLSSTSPSYYEEDELSF